MGYHRAGFEVVGVDVNPQPNYPFEFIQSDWRDFMIGGRWTKWEFDAVHASPPCQAYTQMSIRTGMADQHPRYIEAVRDIITATNRPYIIENVPRAPLLAPVTLCGSAFGRPLKRHRLFESNLSLTGTVCRHDDLPCNIRIMNRGYKMTRFVPIYGSGGCKARELWQSALGIDWTNVTRELSEAIPPDYTEFLGRQVLKTMERAA